MNPVIPSVKAQDEEDLVDPQQTLRVLENDVFHNRSYGILHKGTWHLSLMYLLSPPFPFEKFSNILLPLQNWAEVEVKLRCIITSLVAKVGDSQNPYSNCRERESS